MFPLGKFGFSFNFASWNSGCLQRRALGAFPFRKLANGGFQRTGETLCSLTANQSADCSSFSLGCSYDRTYKYREIEGQGTNHVF